MITQKNSVGFAKGFKGNHETARALFSSRTAWLFRRSWRKLPLVALIAGFALSGISCATIMAKVTSGTGVETEASKAFYAAAMDLVLSKEHGIPYDIFKTSFERKFSGIKWNLAAIKEQLPFTYKDRKYNMMLKMDISKYYFTGVSYCKDVTKE